jgi:hypothetical protein
MGSANPQIPLVCRPQIANPPIFMINPQICFLLITSRLSHKIVPKVVFVNVILIQISIGALCAIFRNEKKYVKVSICGKK